MKNNKRRFLAAVLFAAAMLWICSMAVFAEGASGDNSLSSLGILTEGVQVSPEFYYSTIEYNVKVPVGTQKLELEPVTSNENAWIVDITGTELTNGETTVVITVSAENGSQYSYYLYVKEDASAGTVAPAQVETEPETQPVTEKETEPETEDPRYVRVNRNSLQEAENTISALKLETGSYRDRVGILMKILYGMIGFCVILLFVVINLLLKKKDLKTELENYRGYGYDSQMDGGEPAPAPKKKGRKKKKAAPAKEPYAEEPYAEEPYQQEQYAGEQYPQESYMQEEYGQPYDPSYDDADGYAPSADAQAAPQSQGSYRERDTVPKPSKARKRTKRLPEYQRPEPAPQYQPPQDGKASDNVEITMIDL